MSKRWMALAWKVCPGVLLLPRDVRELRRLRVRKLTATMTVTLGKEKGSSQLPVLVHSAEEVSPHEA